MTQSRAVQTQQLAVLETLAGIAASARDKADQTNAALAVLAQNQTLVADRLAKIESVEQAVRSLAPLLEASGRQLAQMADTQQQANELIRRLAEGHEARHQDTVKTLAGLAATAEAQRANAQRDHDALRNALAAYLNPNR